MKTSELQEKQKQSWELMEAKGLSIGERMKVIASYTNEYKEEYPYVVHQREIEGIYFKSEIKEINNYRFNTKQEVILANSIVNILGSKFNINDFNMQFKHTLRILGIESEWSK